MLLLQIVYVRALSDINKSTRYTAMTLVLKVADDLNLRWVSEDHLRYARPFRIFLEQTGDLNMLIQEVTLGIGWKLFYELFPVATPDYTFEIALIRLMEIEKGRLAFCI